MIFLIGPRHSGGAHDFRAPLEWRGPMKVFFRWGRVAGFVDSCPETLGSSASNRSTPEWTLVDSGHGRADERNVALVDQADLHVRPRRILDRGQAAAAGHARRDLGAGLG